MFGDVLTGTLMDRGLKYKYISILLHKKPNSWQSLHSFGSLTMSSMIQELFTPYSVFSAGWLVFPFGTSWSWDGSYRYKHQSLSQTVKRKGGGKTPFPLLSERKTFLRIPRLPLVLARTGQLANSACRKMGCHDLVKKIPIPPINQGSHQGNPPHTEVLEI